MSIRLFGSSRSVWLSSPIPSPLYIQPFYLFSSQTSRSSSQRDDFVQPSQKRKRIGDPKTSDTYKTISVTRNRSKYRRKFLKTQAEKLMESEVAEADEINAADVASSWTDGGEEEGPENDHFATIEKNFNSLFSDFQKPVTGRADHTKESTKTEAASTFLSVSDSLKKMKRGKSGQEVPSKTPDPIKDLASDQESKDLESESSATIHSPGSILSEIKSTKGVTTIQDTDLTDSASEEPQIGSESDSISLPEGPVLGETEEQRYIRRRTDRRTLREIGLGIRKAALSNDYEGAMAQFEEFFELKSKPRPSRFIFLQAIFACAEKKPVPSWNVALKIYNQLKKYHLKPDLFVMASMLDAAGIPRSETFTFKYLQEVQKKNIFFQQRIGSLIGSSNKSKLVRQIPLLEDEFLQTRDRTDQVKSCALDERSKVRERLNFLCKEMEKFRLVPDVGCYNSMIKSLANVDDLMGVMSLVLELRIPYSIAIKLQQWKPYPEYDNSLLATKQLFFLGTEAEEKLERAKKLHESDQSGQKLSFTRPFIDAPFGDAITYTELLQALGRHDLNFAFGIFHLIKSKNPVPKHSLDFFGAAYNVMLSNCLFQQDGIAALKVWQMMVNDDIPNDPRNLDLLAKVLCTQKKSPAAATIFQAAKKVRFLIPLPPSLPQISFESLSLSDLISISLSLLDLSSQQQLPWKTGKDFGYPAGQHTLLSRDDEDLVLPRLG